MRKFLQSRVVNGGTIPKCSQLRDYYLFDVYEVEKADLKERIRGKNVALIVDELSDDEGRYVLDIMAVILDFDHLSPSGRSVAYLLDTHFLNETNNKTVSQAVVRTVHDFDSVSVFNSDNVSYMKKAFNDTLSNLFPLAVFIPCNSYIINLVASDFKKTFVELNEFMKCFRNLFYVPSGRKSRLLNFLESRTAKKARMPPNPTTKSWSAWFDSAIYYAEFFLVLSDFIKQEVERGRSTASNSLLSLEEMYTSKELVTKIHAQLKLVKDYAPTLLSCLNYFQERMPHATAVHGVMQRLMHYLQVNANAKEDDFSFCFEDSPYSVSSDVRADVIDSAKSAFKAVYEKLSKYVVDGAQPAMPFFEQMRVLDPGYIVDCNCNYNSIDSIPGIESVSKDEWKLYVRQIGPQAVKNLSDGDEIDLKLFWKSKAASLPALYQLASCYCTTTIGSYDVERSFSAYNAMLDNKRRSLDTDSIKAFHFLNWNLRIKSALEEERSLEEETVKTQEKPKKRPVPDFIKLLKAGKEMNVETEQSQKPTSEIDNQHDSSPAPKRCKLTKNNPTQRVGKGTEGKQFRSSIKAFMSNAASKTADSCTPVNAHVAKEPQPTVNFGLDDTSISNIQGSETIFSFPEHKEPLLNCLLDGSVKLSSSSRIIDTKDLEGLLGGKPQDKDNYLNNFVIDAYLHLLKEKSPASVEVIEWQKFETCIGNKPAKQVLKDKASILEQDVVLVPCNPGRSEHWFLLVVLPKEQKIVALDSMARSFVKPTIESAIRKMWRLLKELSPQDLPMNEWHFSCNTPRDIAQQDNGFDCGAFVCLYARCLLLASPSVAKQSITAFRKVMIVELHEQQIYDLDSPTIVEGRYYAVDYKRLFYFGRVIKCGGPQVTFKFLYSVSASSFDWPKRDDIYTCPQSSVFYGPVTIVGVGPFTVPQHAEVGLVHRYFKKSRKTT